MLRRGACGVRRGRLACARWARLIEPNFVLEAIVRVPIHAIVIDVRSVPCERIDHDDVKCAIVVEIAHADRARGADVLREG